jgi:hypothetical protein
MKTKIYDKATEYIDSIAQSLGVAAEHVYGILVRQQIADGVTTLIIFGVLLAVFGTVVGVSLKKANWSEDDVYCYVALFGGIALAFIFVIGCFESAGAIKQLINPEYYAIKEIMDVIKGASD